MPKRPALFRYWVSAWVLLSAFGGVAGAQDQALKVYQNYDFQPGEKILFEDDFKGDKDGEFPAHWKLEAGQAVLNNMGDDLALFLIDGNYARVSPRMKTASYLAGSIAGELLASVAGAPPSAALRDQVRAALAGARQKISAVATAEALKLSAFSTTVVGAVGCRDYVLLFQIGDGTAVAFGPADEIRAVSLGRPKEYANETYFLTDESWSQSLLFEEADGVDSILLVTDGVSPFLLERDVPKASFYQPILEFLRRQGAGKGASAIQRLLTREAVRKVVADDKTLLWAQWLGGVREEPVVTRESAELAG
jgi:hypothetical protein